VAENERASEIARMLSGGVADEYANAHARDLLEKLGGQKKRSQRSS
jgi:DNA repair ATPase RecN